jgi:hypothetical protein
MQYPLAFPYATQVGDQAAFFVFNAPATWLPSSCGRDRRCRSDHRPRRSTTGRRAWRNSPKPSSGAKAAGVLDNDRADAIAVDAVEQPGEASRPSIGSALLTAASYYQSSSATSKPARLLGTDFNG